MKYTKTKICVECPFKKGAMKAWLGVDDVNIVMTKVHSEEGYPCNMDMAGKPNDENGYAILDDVEQCVGAILHAEKTCKSYRNPDLYEMQNRLTNSTEKNNVLGFEFRDYHILKRKNKK